ncbi:MAG: hypothetical protein RLZZ511_3636 [Cyanobacteriota bacterium]
MELAGDGEAVEIVAIAGFGVEVGGGLFVVEGEAGFSGFDAVAEDFDDATGLNLVEDAFVEAFFKPIAVAGLELGEGFGLGVAEELEELVGVEAVGAIVVFGVSSGVACVLDEALDDEGFESGFGGVGGHGRGLAIEQRLFSNLLLFPRKWG